MKGCFPLAFLKGPPYPETCPGVRSWPWPAPAVPIGCERRGEIIILWKKLGNVRFGQHRAMVVNTNSIASARVSCALPPRTPKQ